MFMQRISILGVLCTLCLVTTTALSKEYHVCPGGSDANAGSIKKPFRSISAAAQVALPGDVITVHEGVYRERIDPPRGGISNSKRITYQAAPGEQVVIKGSEITRGWEKVKHDTWKVVLPSSFFGTFNPFDDLIRGDWFKPKDRKHHTGAVYLNGHWLTEAKTLDHTLAPLGQFASDYSANDGGYLLNVAWFETQAKSGTPQRVRATQSIKQKGTQKAECSEGGQCVGYIATSHWLCYQEVDFGHGCETITFRAASQSRGGRIDIRLASPTGTLLGSCLISNTGGWQSWRSFTAPIIPTWGKQTLYLVFKDITTKPADDLRLWFAQVDENKTTLWAQFSDTNPNQGQVEINVRQSVFYPSKPGRNYITVRGFTMMHAATPWAPPTAEQIGLVGTHWSKGWIIEDNDIRYSACTGITLGKYGDEFDNTSANLAEGYVKTIERGLANGWSGDNIGHHRVRNNHISHCEQAGIVGSLGPIFSSVTGNTIHDIHVRQLFTGHEMAGIKFHGAVDTLISDNHIYRTSRGIWLDWMTQGTRVTRNLLHDNDTREDLFVEVNHGPYLVDHNILLSRNSLLVNSQGGAYAHNLMAGNIRVIVGEKRKTPHLKEHGTEVVGLASNLSGDERFYNNIFVKGGLSAYDRAVLPVAMEGNVSLLNAKPSKYETGSLVTPTSDPEIKLAKKEDSVLFQMNFDPSWSTQQLRKLVTTERLGKVKTPNLPFVQADDSPYRLDTDYFGKKRKTNNPFPGPFANPGSGTQTLKVR